MDVLGDVAPGTHVTGHVVIPVDPGEAAVLDRQPVVEAGQVVDTGDGGPHSLLHPDRLEGDVLPQELREVGSSQVAWSRASEDGGGGDSAPLARRHEIGEADEVVAGLGDDGVGVVVDEGNVARQRHPVELDELGRLLGAGEAGRGGEGRLAGVRTHELERPCRLGVGELGVATERDELEVLGPAGLERLEQERVGSWVDLPLGVVG